MLNVSFAVADQIRLLCLGAHSDDIEIGCGGTILRLIESYPRVSVRWLVFASNTTRRAEAIASAELFLRNVQDKQIDILDYRDGFFPYIGGEIKDVFEGLKSEPPPDIVFTHYRHDRHQDHRVISDLTWNTFRNHLILEYEIPKYDGDLGNPNFFVALDENVVERKTGAILSSFDSQSDKQWFSDDTFRALLRLRGIESNAPSRYAEAFYLRKLVLQS
jgi:LmbE family N-acetylglucosaminyl deacetylase